MGYWRACSRRDTWSSVLTERVALLSWRLHRVIRYETESIALYQEQIEEDLARQRRFGSGVLGAYHPEEVRWKLKDAQRTHRTLKKFARTPRRQEPLRRGCSWGALGCLGIRRGRRP